MDNVIKDIKTERARQDAKWGIQNHHPLEWISILTEEVGEVCRAANEAHWGDKSLIHYRTEMLEVAAVALAAVENLDKQLTAKAAFEREARDVFKVVSIDATEERE